MGISSNDRWDFVAGDTGRMRSFVHNGIVISGGRSVSLDAIKSTTIGIANQLAGTFNLSNYNTSNDEVRLEFDYVIHGIPNNIERNNVWLGLGLSPATHVYTYDIKANEIGTVKNSGSISLTDVLLDNNKTFTSDFQLLFNQFGSTVIGDIDRGEGITIDNVRLYTVQNDVQLISIVTPQYFFLW